MRRLRSVSSKLPIDLNSSTRAGSGPCTLIQGRQRPARRWSGRKPGPLPFRVPSTRLCGKEPRRGRSNHVAHRCRTQGSNRERGLFEKLHGDTSSAQTRVYQEPCNNADFGADSGCSDHIHHRCRPGSHPPQAQLRLTRQDQPCRRASGALSAQLHTAFPGYGKEIRITQRPLSSASQRRENVHPLHILRSIRPRGGDSIQSMQRLPTTVGSALRRGTLGAGDADVDLRS